VWQLVEASGIGTAPTNTQDNAYCQLWNAYTDRTIWLRELGYSNILGGAGRIALKRTTARGTNTTTVAGTFRDSTATSSATLDLTWSVEATKTGRYLRREQYASPIGPLLQWTYWQGEGLAIPQSTGLAMVVPTNAAGIAGEHWAVWEEEA